MPLLWVTGRLAGGGIAVGARCRCTAATATATATASATATAVSGVGLPQYPVQVERTQQPEYPPIMDKSRRANLRRKNESWFEAVKQVATVEEKIFKINMPHYYGWNSLTVTPAYLVTALLHGLPAAQTLTRTHIVGGLQPLYEAHQTAASSLASRLRPRVEAAISAQHHALKRTFQYSPTPHSDELQRDKLLSKFTIKQINRIIMTSLSESVAHLSESQVDFEPRIEGFWMASLQRPQYINDRKSTNYDRKGRPFAYDRIDRPVQYIDEPVLTLRNKVPLEPLMPYNEIDNPTLEYPDYKYNIKSVGLFPKYRHATNIPGFWPGDPHEFGLLSYHTREFLIDRPKSFGPEDTNEVLLSYGILASFGWLCAQASYQGFSTYNDITYPFVTQTVVSDGQYWSFFAYQMNTMTLHKDCYEENEKRNICYYTEPLKLYESIDEDGNVIGFNEDVFKTLIQFYLNTPKEKENVDMKPYLDKDVRVIADIPDKEKRMWLEKHYKHLISLRPRGKLPYEIYMWEEIYKIRFNMRFMDAKKRPFEKDENPFKRRLDEHAAEYITRYDRPLGYMDKIHKRVKSYYP